MFFIYENSYMVYFAATGGHQYIITIYAGLPHHTTSVQHLYHSISFQQIVSFFVTEFSVHCHPVSSTSSFLVECHSLSPFFFPHPLMSFLAWMTLPSLKANTNRVTEQSISGYCLHVEVWSLILA